jgi:hypothetical protein
MLGAPNTRAAILSGGWNPSMLGEKLLLWLDSEDPNSLVLSSSLVDSWSARKGPGGFSQSVTGLKPVANGPQTINGRPSITFDSIDDCLTQVGSGSLPVGSNTVNLELLALERNSTSPATTTTQNMLSYGTATGSAVRLARNASGGINRRQLSVGNGVSQTAVFITNAPANVKCFTHARIVPGTIGIRFNREVEQTAALTHVIGAGNSAIGAAESGLSNYWNGPINTLIGVTNLVDDEREALRQWFYSRGGI